MRLPPGWAPSARWEGHVKIHTHTHTHGEGGTPHFDGGRDQSVAFTRQECPGLLAATRSKRQGNMQREQSTGVPGFCSCSLQELKRIHFCCLKPLLIGCSLCGQETNTAPTMRGVHGDTVHSKTAGHQMPYPAMALTPVNCRGLGECP